MFFFTYLRRELRRRMRQAIFIALGLALGIGLVVTVTAASAGVKQAQADVLRSLYGVGTDVTVTGAAPRRVHPGNTPPKGAQTFQIGPGGAQVCQNGRCHNPAGETIDHLESSGYRPISQSKIAEVARLSGVKAAVGGLVLTDTSITIPKHFGQPGGALPTPNSFTVDGADTSHLGLGPLSSGTITSGRSLRSSDATSNVAVVDSSYAASHKLKVGSTVRIVKHSFTVVGIVAQPQGGSPPNVYIPLARAQALGSAAGKSLKHDVNTIYVTAASAAVIPTVQAEIRNLLPGDTVTTAASLASQVTGSLSSTAKLANDLGRWLSVVVLIAAFAVASLLTMAAVARRVREFGTLKALGWRSRRIIAQVMGESMVIGIVGGAAGIALGFAGAAIITAVAPELSASVGSSASPNVVSVGGAAAGRALPQAAAPTVAVPMSASVTVAAIVAAVLLAVAGGLLAGSFGSWRIARLRPADALARVA
ncbi:MAG: FtsX-like permease family protein [Actinobacteria bacterium]|nr:FtsX-like permease family protein [Actinomycetota bacterium]